MSRKLSTVIAWACLLLLVAMPAAAMFYLIELERFAALVRGSIGLPIQWHTISNGQWYSMWTLSVAYLAIGLAGIYFLRRAFTNFSRGELFNLANSRDLRRFALLLLAQTLATPVHRALSSLVLSINHPPGQKMISVTFGSNELKAIGVAFILWVLSDLLVEACRLHTENKQFV